MYLPIRSSLSGLRGHPFEATPQLLDRIAYDQLRHGVVAFPNDAKAGIKETMLKLIPLQLRKRLGFLVYPTAGCDQPSELGQVLRLDEIACDKLITLEEISLSREIQPSEGEPPGFEEDEKQIAPLLA